MPEGLEAVAAGFLVVVIVFVGLALKYAAKAGAVKRLWIGAKFGKWFNLGVEIERFDAETDTPAISSQTQADTRPAPGGNAALARGDRNARR